MLVAFICYLLDCSKNFKTYKIQVAFYWQILYANVASNVIAEIKMQQEVCCAELHIFGPVIIEWPHIQLS